jgi:hypothetical protein
MKGRKRTENKKVDKKMEKKIIAAVFFFIMMLATMSAMELQSAKAWYGETDGDNPKWNSNPSWDGDGWYVQCHHRSPYYGSAYDVWTSTGFAVHYDTYPYPCGYDQVHWYWTSGLGSTSQWMHWGSTSDTASVNLYTTNTYYDGATPQWQTVGGLYGYIRYFEYLSSEFNPPVTYASASTACVFYNLQTLDYYFISSTTDPWSYMHAHLN